MHKNQKGFGHIGIIIIIVVIAFVGFSGWFVWSKSSSNDDMSSKTSSENRNTNENASPESDTTSEPNDMVALSSWGLKFTPPTTMKDLISTAGSNDVGEQYVAFSMPELKNLESNTYCDVRGDTQAESPHHLGHLFKLEGSNVEGVDGKMIVKQYSDYAVVYRKPADNCFAESANQQRSNQLMNELYTSLKETISKE